MRIQDYETGRQLNDISVELTAGEADELMVCLRRMIERDDLRAVHITDLNEGLLARELSVSIRRPSLVA